MKHILYTITLGLSLLPCFLIACQNAPTEEQKKEWAANAERYKAMITALGGKFADSDHANDHKKTETQPSPSLKKIIGQQSKL